MPIDCDAIVVSDLHLGRRGKARPKAVRRFFEDIAQGTLLWRPKQVVLAGDVFQDLDFRKWPRSHWAALDAIRALEAVLPVVWVRGNHDGPFEAVRFLCGQYGRAEPVGHAVTSAGKRYMVTHGDAWSSYAGASALSYRDAVARLRDDWPHYDRTGLREAVAVARGAVAYARTAGFHGVVCGHTHGPFCGYFGGTRPADGGGTKTQYANCGSWTKGNPPTFVTLRDGYATLHRYDHKDAR